MEYELSEMLNRIKELKKLNKVNNIQLAEKANMPLGTLSKILAGKTREPSIESILRIAKALNTSAEYLIYGQLPKTPTADISSTDLQFFKDYLSMSEQGKELARGMVDALKDKYKKQDILSNLENQIG